MELRQAVTRYLDEFYEDDESGSRIQWPAELQRLVHWKPPEERT